MEYLGAEYGKSVRENMLNVIVEYIEKHGYAPSFEEIGKMCFLSSKSSVHNHFHKLIEDGKIEFDTECLCSRAYRVVGCKMVKE